ncbi:MAG TPA: hypothetical protein PLK61_11310 [Nitrosomonas sp.]|nr:hypothetical protein [Nitrosomonas sp.]
MNTEKKPFPKAGEAVQIEMNIHQCKFSGAVLIFNNDMSSQGYPCFGKATVTFTMPDGDAIQAMVTALQEEIKTEKANHHVKITQLEGRIQELLAIGHDGGVE